MKKIKIQNIISWKFKINDNIIDEYNNKYFKTSFYNTQDNYKENPLLKSNNSMPQNENIYSNTLIDFSFKK